MYVHMYTYIYIYICVYMYVCVYICRHTNSGGEPTRHLSASTMPVCNGVCGISRAFNIALQKRAVCVVPTVRRRGGARDP